MENVVVAGGTSGIGRGCVQELLRTGNNVVAAGRSDDHARALAKWANENGLSESLTVVVADLATPLGAQTLTDAVGARAVDGLVNCVGTISRGGILEETLDGWTSVTRGTLDAAFLLAKEFAQRWERGSSPAIVNVSSVCSVRPCSSIAYSTSKAAIDMFTRCLARDLAPIGIRVNTVNPSVVESNLQLSAGIFLEQGEYSSWLRDMAAAHPLGAGDVDAVVAGIIFLLGNDSRWTTGASLLVDGGRAL